jgi:hypothetical protein
VKAGLNSLFAKEVIREAVAIDIRTTDVHGTKILPGLGQYYEGSEIEK